MTTSEDPGTVYLLHLDPAYRHARHYTGKSESSRFLKAVGLLDGSEFGELAAWVRLSDGSAGHEGPEHVEVRFGWQPVGRVVGEPGQQVLGHQVLLVGRGLVGVAEGPQVTDHSQRHAAPRLQESRTRFEIAEDCTGMPTQIQGSASDTSARLSCHLTCDKGRRAAARARTNCRQVQHWTRDLDARLEAHRAGQGARLMEVVRKAGGSFRLARTWTGGRDRERAIKNRHEAPRLCPVCSPEPRPVQEGKSAAQPEPVRPAATLTQASAAPLPRASAAPQPRASAAPRPQASTSGPEAWPWPGQPAPQPAADPEIDAVVDALIERWRSPEADAQPEPQPELEPEPEAAL